MPRETVEIAIADDHPLIIQGLQKMLARYSYLRITGTYSNGKELKEGLQYHVPDILLLDIQLPDQTGDELAPELLSAYPQLKIIVLTNFDSTVYASKMLWQGIHGYLLKTSGEDLMLQAIDAVLNGDVFIEHSIREKMNQEPVRSQKLLTEKLSLTAREREVLQLIVEGHTDKEIAKKIFLGIPTVKYYRLNLLLKLDVKNTASLVSKAIKSGLV